MKRKTSIVFLTILCVVASLLCACKKPSSSSNGLETMPDNVEKTLELNTSDVSALTIGDTIVINAEYTYEQGAKLQWQSSDETIVTVEELDRMNCGITAVNVGTATVTATYGELVATCTVTTTTSGIYPVLMLENEVEMEGGLNKLPSDKIDLGA